MDKKIIHQISEQMKGKTTEELTRILNEKDKSQWSEEAFEAIKQILSKRGVTRVNVKTLENQRNIDGLMEVITSSNLDAYSDDERKDAAEALGRINALEAVDHLSNIVNDSSVSFPIRSNAIYALGEIGSPKAVNQLLIALEDKIEAIREEALEALKKIDDPIAKEATQIRSCQVCHEAFPQGKEKRTICLSCLSLNRVGGWLFYFIIATFASSLSNLYAGYKILSQDIQNYYLNLLGIDSIIFGSLLLIGFFLLIFKVSIARKYMMFIVIICPIVLIWHTSNLLYNLPTWSEIRNEIGRNSVLLLFSSIIWFGYFWRSKRVKTVYRKKS